MKSLWSERSARGLEGLDLLVFTSRLIGAHPDLVVWGGGNSSVKVTGVDHTGQSTRILWIKGSGSDMKTIAHRNFTPLRLDQLLPLVRRRAMSDEEMVAYQSQCVLQPGAPKPSIETLLHAFLPATHIYHTHADAICALTDTPHSARVVREVFGGEVALVPYYRPGFLLSKVTARIFRKTPGVQAIILDKHGLITWGETAREAYRQTLRRVTQAERYIAQKSRGKKVLGGVRVKGLSAQKRRTITSQVMPVLRGALSRSKRMVLCHDDSPEVLAFVNAQRTSSLSQIGPFTPDHLMHIKPWPLYLEVSMRTNPAGEILKAIPGAVAGYRQHYKNYFQRYKTPGVVMLDANPRVILIPGLGMFTAGKNPQAARITHDLYLHTLRVIQAASAVERYRTLTPRQLCDFEYWPMENFKLTLLPPEKEFSRRIALITGAARGIGKAIATQLAQQGAQVILADLDIKKVSDVAQSINQAAGQPVAAALRMDVSDEKAVYRGFQEAVRLFGGLDILISNAGIARTAPADRLSLKDWEDSLAVNATGHFLVCREAVRIFKAQGIGGGIVVVATKNVFAPGKDFGAYSASKAAQAQFSRILAIEGGEHGIRVNMVNPDGIFQDSGLWSEKIRRERARAHGIPVREVEDFYARRNLLKTRVLAEDVAEAVLFLASERSAKTTGAVLPVDGGVREAFPR